MELNVEELKIKNTTKCECGHEFTEHDITELKRINKDGFYGNIVKHYSNSICPECEKEAILLLKQVGQTYKVINVATTSLENAKSEQEQANNDENMNTQEFICPECKKVCKSQIGLNSHMNTHKK